MNWPSPWSRIPLNFLSKIIWDNLNIRKRKITEHTFSQWLEQGVLSAWQCGQFQLQRKAPEFCKDFAPTKCHTTQTSESESKDHCWVLLSLEKVKVFSTLWVGLLGLFKVFQRSLLVGISNSSHGFNFASSILEGHLSTYNSIDVFNLHIIRSYIQSYLHGLTWSCTEACIWEQ